MAHTTETGNLKSNDVTSQHDDTTGDVLLKQYHPFHISVYIMRCYWPCDEIQIWMPCYWSLCQPVSVCWWYSYIVFFLEWSSCYKAAAMFSQFVLANYEH